MKSFHNDQMLNYVTQFVLDFSSEEAVQEPLRVAKLSGAL